MNSFYKHTRIPSPAETASRSLVKLSTFVVLTAICVGRIYGGDPQKASSKNPKAKAYTLERSHQVRSGGLLTVEADRGSIEINVVEQNEVSFEVIRMIDGKHLHEAEEILKRHEIKIASDGHDATVKSQFKPLEEGDIKVEGLKLDLTGDVRKAMKQALNRRLHSIRFKISVPRDYNVNLSTSGGKTTVADLRGNVRCETCGGGVQLGRISGSVWAKTSGGSISLEGCAKPVELRTSGGSIKVGDVGGAAIVQTSGGSIHLGHVSGAAIAKTSGGSIHIENAEGAVQATTSGGSVSAVIAKQPKEGSQFSTSGGSIRIGLAKDLALNIKTQGRVNGPFFSNSSRQKSGKRSHQVQLNGGGPELIAKNSSGGNIGFYYVDSK